MRKKYRFFTPLLIVRWSVSNTLARPDALTCTLSRIWGRGMCVGWSRDTHSIPYGTQKGVSPVTGAWSFSNTLARPLMRALTCTPGCRRGRGMCVGHSGHTPIPFLRDTEAGVGPATERPLKSIPEVAYIKVAPVSGLCEMIRG
ncbi:hypothetical protein TNIN_93081 [Trichonephila inaurata madagascariensis]|uniref:Secreted protein n=1 Tax=Trichonephila inaurata madagascariensis TaxID=2747483 RepID=A0A8X6YID9_9ARAC|nr:hypothetical protein TNIN_93081 [Trichonephila inaurata madagascariensis]